MLGAKPEGSIAGSVFLTGKGNLITHMNCVHGYLCSLFLTASW